MLGLVSLHKRKQLIEGKETKILHPITYMSGLFHGSQINWACLTKEAYAIYMSIKKLAYFLEDADITLRSDHLPLKKFLAKNTLNSKVNNWAIEISPFHITFEYIKGIKNTLADTMSRLIDIDPQIQQDPEPEGYEFGYFAFDTLPVMEVSAVETKECLGGGKENNMNSIVSLPLSDSMLSNLQSQEMFCSHILTQIEKGKIKEGQIYVVQNKILKRYVIDGNNTYETIVLSRALTAQVLRMAHDDLGHNGTHRTYMLLKWLYYWKGLKPSVVKHMQRCYHCQ